MMTTITALAFSTHLSALGKRALQLLKLSNQLAIVVQTSANDRIPRNSARSVPPLSPLELSESRMRSKGKALMTQCRLQNPRFSRNLALPRIQWAVLA
jgi:hypothetical protein